ncbi:substrate-binding domain-containing protein [Verrucomicrobiaceae bacterium N1E253]|uniref:Substrate-binding domain-containing protein n=1 Tax=Oceaniferula marina TaxID=2748318 RepID=A0A851GKS1_9BACT|nr:substrate-binding domain-containing protein [Oceaniferula marina]NWK54764.1 substrate-binding domain-containing protein [Oceaniferula marina]
MTRQIPSSKIAQATEILRSAIAKGEWEEFLPSERVLSSQLQISRVTLRKALDSLTHEGLIAAAERSKRRAILAKKSGAESVSRVVFLTQKPAHESPAQVLSQYAQLCHYLSKVGLEVQLESSDIFQYNQVSQDVLTRLVESHDRAHWVLHQCPEFVQLWFFEQGISATVFGSAFPGINLPSVDVDFRSAGRHATGYLLARGHRRLAMVRFRSTLAGDDLAYQGMVDALMSPSSILPRPSPVVMSHNYDVARLTRELDRLFSLPDPPTGLVVVNFHHVLTMISHLSSIGLSVPGDVSIISLSDDVVFESFSPRPVSYRLGDVLVKKLVRQVIDSVSGVTDHRQVLLISEQIPGGTVAKLS